MTGTRHQPYSMSEPPQTDSMDELRRYLAEELRRIEVAQNGVDLDIETRWDDLRVPLELVKLGGQADPEYTIFRNGTRVTKFSPTVAQEVFFSAQLPHAYKQKSTLKPHIHWTHTGTASVHSNYCVVWGLEYTRANLNGVFGPTQTLYVTATCSTLPYTHKLSSFGDITASDALLSHMLMCRLFRAATQGGDTYTADACALEFDFHIELDSHGSEQEYYKED